MTTKINRRAFIVSTSAAAIGAAATAQGAEQPAAPHAFRAPSGSLIPFSRSELTRQGPQRTFTADHLSEIAFPLGGIGTGTVSLGGRGELRDWEIFNRPGKGKILPFTFVALWARPEGGKASVRVVEAPLTPPYRGGFGFERESAQGLPRFKGARFTGAYPFARIDFEDDTLPVKISLEAFNPFVPLNVDDSSLPVALFHYRLTCQGSKPIDLALAFSILNAVGYDGIAKLSGHEYAGFGKNVTTLRSETISPELKVTGLDMTSSKYGPDSPQSGSMALLTTHSEATGRTGWEGGQWWDSFQKWFDEFAANGEMHDPKPDEATLDGRSNYATLAPRLRLAPGESKTISFLLAWYFPVRENYWNKEEEVKGQRVRNDYGTRFKSAWEAGRYTAANLKELEEKTRSFHKTFFSSTLPDHVLDAVSSQASIIRTNTCLLLEGKRFYAFEGCGDDSGCCPMNCTHVWNYEQALAFLFPELERSMRRTDFKDNMRPDGSMAFRTLVPVGRGQWKFKPAADGQMGCVMKLYREWQLSGDDAFLKELWPQAKKALEYAWQQWDADHDGVMEGEQHNTYDIEFYGPNTMMGTLYLGALRAGERMAAAVGDKEAAEKYHRIRESGSKKLEDLWNGDYYVQKVPPPDQIHAQAKGSDEAWHADAVQNGQVRYQYGDGCLSDQLLGQWFAAVVGLEYALTPERVRKTLQSIYRYNFKHSFYEHPNTQRIYALNDEKGLLLCSWPKGNRPALPFVYSDEVWTGIEYQVAAHLIYEGFIEEGLSIVKGVRDRYDGARRNPWNEVECGSHYARALASWSVLLALSGYHYSAPEQRFTFSPRLNIQNFQCFFSTGTGWGSYNLRVEKPAFQATLKTHYGEVRVRSLRVRNELGTPTVSIASAAGPDGKPLGGAKITRTGDSFEVDLGEQIRVPSGKALTIKLAATSAQA
jgi:uncharacterized protein (DUF608 family)